MTHRFDAVVIGAGVIGASVALELARAGRSVVVVDKGPSAGAGSTSSSVSIIRFSYSTIDSVLTAWEAAAMWHDWQSHLGTVDPDGMVRFIRTGMCIFNTPDDNTERVRRLWDDVGIPYSIAQVHDLRQLLPGVDLGAYFPPKRIDDPKFADDAPTSLTALVESEAGFIDDPKLAAGNLAFAAKERGAQFRFHQHVVSIDRAGGRAVGVSLAGGEQILAPVVINVGGPHSSVINQMAGVADSMRIRNRPMRAEVYTVGAPMGLRLEDGVPTVADGDIGQYIRPQPGGTWLVGGTEPKCDELHWIDDPDNFDEYPSVDLFEVSMMRLARRVPEFGVPHRPVGLAALYDVADDWVPIYDKSDLPGYFMACGTSGNQFKNAPIVGQFMRDIIDAEQAGTDHDTQPVQFLGKRTGRSINLGAFSRLREKAVTSGSVMG